MATATAGGATLVFNPPAATGVVAEGVVAGAGAGAVAAALFAFVAPGMQPLKVGTKILFSTLYDVGPIVP